MIRRLTALLAMVGLIMLAMNVVSAGAGGSVENSCAAVPAITAVFGVEDAEGCGSGGGAYQISRFWHYSDGYGSYPYAPGHWDCGYSDGSVIHGC